MDAPSYLFIFGRTPQLSFRELQSFVPKATMVDESVSRADDAALDANHMITLLGGTTKIAQLVGTVPELFPQVLLSFLDTANHSVEFGLSFYNCSQIPKKLDSEMKKKLEQSGI
jgi:hypothetical protein